MSYKKGKLAKEILIGLAGGAALSATLAAPNLAKALSPLIKLLAQRTDAKPKSIKKALFKLKAQRLVDFREEDGKIRLKITENGRKRVLVYKLDDLKIAQPKRWDGRWRLVIFDIPEKKRNARLALREKLQGLGFYPLQKSCFVHPFECKNEIDFISEVFQIAPYINYVTAQSIEGDDFLKKYFDL